MLLRPLVALSAAAVLSILTASTAGALTCVVLDDVRRAAREAVAGRHPLWADGYIIGRVDAVERDESDGVRLRVTPTHVFGDDRSASLTLAARPDGPPPPGSWRAGSVWFLSLLDDAPTAGADATVAPCAPNFEVTAPDDIVGLVGAAPETEVREPGIEAGQPRGPTGGLLVTATTATVVVLASVMAFRRRALRSRREADR